MRRMSLILILPVIAACASPRDDQVGAAQAAAPAFPLLPSNEQIISAVYDAEYTVPDGFFIDERVATSGSYTVHHVRDVSATYELCSDEFDQALEWEAADNESRAVSGVFVGTYENEKYFEFVRELAYTNDIGAVEEPTSPGFARVFKCSAIDREGVYANGMDGYAGILNIRPLTAGVLREVVEYLWQFTFFGTSRPKVLDSYASDRPDAFEHTLLVAFVFKQGYGQCDRIEVFEWIHSAAKESGNLRRTFDFLFALEAIRDAGVPRECD